MSEFLFTNAYYKYLKYKNKYINLKNQFAGSQGSTYNVYTVLGHGCTLDEKLRIPKDCQYVTAVPLDDTSSSLEMYNIIFNNAFRKNHELLINPKANIPQLEKLFEGASISVHYYTDNETDITGSYYNAMYFPFTEWYFDSNKVLLSKEPNCIISALSSGMYKLGSNINKVVNKIDDRNTFSAINELFKGSIYPPMSTVLNDVNKHNIKIDEIGTHYKITQEKLFEKHPGVYFNFVCRSKCDDKFLEEKMELRRQDSLKATQDELSKYVHDPVHKACYSNNLTELKKIIKKENINLRDIDGNTPFMIIFKQINNKFDSTEIINFLLSKKPRLTITNYKFQNILHLLNENNIKYIQLIIKYLGNSFDYLLNEQDLVGYTPLMTSISNDYINVINFFLSKQCNLDLIDCFNNTALHLLLYKNDHTLVNIELLNKLITTKNINMVAKNISTPKLTPFLIASIYYNKDIINFLISKGANKDVKDDFGNTPLLLTFPYYEFNNRNIDLAKHFISNNQFIHDYNVFGDNILIKACMEKENDIINLLLDKIDLLHKNINGYCALSYLNDNYDIANNLLNKIIERYHISEYVDYKIKEAKKEYSILFLAYKFKKYTIVIDMININPNLIKQEIDYKNLLHIAATENNIEIVKFLLEKNININIMDGNNNVALHYAVSKNNVEIVKLLCTKTDINLKLFNSDKNTVLDIACINKYDTILEILISLNVQKRIKKDNFERYLKKYIIGRNKIIPSKDGYEKLIKLFLEQNKIEIYE